MVKYYSVIKKNELSLHKLTWKDTNYILNESDMMESCLYNIFLYAKKYTFTDLSRLQGNDLKKKMLNEVFKLSKLIVSGKKSEMGKKGMYGGRNKIKLPFLTLYTLDLFNIFTNE